MSSTTKISGYHKSSPENNRGEFLRTPEAIDMANRARIVDSGVYVMGRYVSILPESVVKAGAILAQPANYAKAVANNLISTATQTFQYEKPVATDSKFDQAGSRQNTSGAVAQSAQITNDSSVTNSETNTADIDPVVAAQRRVLDALNTDTLVYSSDLANAG